MGLKHDAVGLAQQYAEIQQQELSVWEHYAVQGAHEWSTVWEYLVSQHAQTIVIIEVDTGREVSYAELDALANKVAAWSCANIAGKLVGVYAPNSIEFIAAVLGLVKAGKVAVLFNEREPEHGVIRSATQYGIKDILCYQVDEIAATELSTTDISMLLNQEGVSGEFDRDLRAAVSFDDPAVIIFTSGTSGLKKPALFSHRRMVGAGIAWSLRTGMQAQERCYIPLPLCHGNGLAVALSSCMTVGATAVIRRRFSVRGFFDDIRDYVCRSSVYIGELWQYLLEQPPQASDTTHPLRIIFGNGLKQNLWEEVTTRFGIEHVVEHFGATEMPASALTNWTGQVGYCGFIPPEHPDAQGIILVDSHGQPVANGQAGEALFQLPQNCYRGYLDPSLDKEKLWDVDGKTWWRSGDLLQRTDTGFFRFIERLGDSYRWKGENISPVEIERVLQASGLCTEVAVYGVDVPHYHGKAGMASLVFKDDQYAEHIPKLLQYLKQELAEFAIPRFIRVMTELQVTETLKIKKSQFAREGFSFITQFPHYILRDGVYRLMTKQTVIELQTDKVKL